MTEAEPPQLPAWRPDAAGVSDLLTKAEFTACELLPWGSNYTFLAHLDGGEAGPGLAIYKPRKGEAPLWDFPDGTLYRREYGSYLLGEALQWCFIPPTVIREGPHGIGSLQLFIPSVRGASYFSIREERAADLQCVAAFDCLTNNADRKGGHCLLGVDGRVWGIDHGLTFNIEPKLRTVIWDFQLEPIDGALLTDLRRVCADDDLMRRLARQLDPREVQAFRRRCERAIREGVFPALTSRRSIPWGW